MELQDQKIGEICDEISEHFELEKKDVRKFVAQVFPEVKEKNVCANCGKSMRINKYSFNYATASLLLGMAKVVKHKRNNGLEFQEANQINISKEVDGNYFVKSAMTQLRFLGMITKIKEDGKHNQKKGWVITTRGWDALKNEPVQKSVSTFNNQIKNRSDEKITISSALKKAPHEYDPSQWYGIDGYMDGKLF